MTIFNHELPSLARRWLHPLMKEARDRQRRRRMWLATLGLALAIAGGAVAMTRGTHELSLAGRGSAIPDPCSLVTNAEVATVLGNPVQYRTVQAFGRGRLGLRTCRWTAVPYSSHTYNNNTLMLSVARMTRAQFAANALAERTRGAIPVRGVGAEAFRTSGPAYFLSFYARGHAFMFDGGSPDKLGGETKLARQVVARLR